MWKVLASRLAPKLKLAFIKDTPDKSVIKALGLAEAGKDTVRVVTWSNGEMLAYDGEPFYRIASDRYQACSNSTLFSNSLHPSHKVRHPPLHPHLQTQQSQLKKQLLNVHVSKPSGMKRSAETQSEGLSRPRKLTPRL
jgi:hypothetical protein